MIPPTVLTSGAANTGSAVTTTASVTPNKKAVYLLVMAAQKGTAFANPDTTAVAGGSLTWTRVNTGYNNTDADIESVWIGYGDAPTAGTITITLSGTPTRGRYAILEFSGARQVGSGAFPTGYTLTANGTGTTGTLGAWTWANLTQTGAQLVTFWYHATAESVTPDSTGATWTEVHDSSTSTTGICLEIQQLAGPGDFTNTATWATSSRWIGVLVELGLTTTDAAIPDVEPLFLQQSLVVLPLDAETDADAWAIIGA